MTKTEELSIEDKRVLDWRQEQAIIFGYSEKTAKEIAKSGVEIRRLEDLGKTIGDLELAWRILRP